MNAAIAIAKHFKVNHWQVTRVKEWKRVFFAVVKGLGSRFVSKKVVKMEKQFLSHVDGAQKLADELSAAGKKAKLWCKKDNETRIYTQYGYLRVAPATESSSQCQYFTKSYEIPELKPFVEKWNELYTIEANTPQSSQRVLMQEDEDGIIAPEGQHEVGVHIVREWWA